MILDHQSMVGNAVWDRRSTFNRRCSRESLVLRELDRVVPAVSTHFIIGNRGRRGDLLSSSDGVVPFASAHLPSAVSEVIVPTGHGGSDHPFRPSSCVGSSARKW
jgi:hypothetical protein